MKTATRRKPAATAPAQFHTLQLPPLASEWPGEGGIFAGIRKHDGHEVAVIVPLDHASDIDAAPTGSIVVLTVAHLDHDPTNNGEPGNRPNLRLWCQRCHLGYDRAHHLKNARATRRARKALGDLFEDPA